MKIKTIRLNDKDEIMLKELSKWYTEKTGFKVDESKVIKFLIENDFRMIKEQN